MEKILEYTVTEEDLPATAGQLLKRKWKLSDRQIRRVKFKPGGITINGCPARVTEAVGTGDVLRAALEENREGSCHLLGKQGELDILYEDEDLVLVNKPAGLTVHPAHGHYSDTLANYLVYHYRQLGQEVYVRPVGRLDKDTSGIVILAKNRVAAARLAGGRPSVRKEYWALVYGHLSEKQGCIDYPIGSKPGLLNQMEVSEKGKPAVTHYRVLKEYGAYSLVSLWLETGRTHQIRVHMASMGHPLLGDWVYGEGTQTSTFSGQGEDAQARGKNSESTQEQENGWESACEQSNMERTALHCRRVRICQPFTGEVIQAEAPVPEDMLRFISASNEHVETVALLTRKAQ